MPKGKRRGDAYQHTMEYRHLSPDERRAKGKALRRPSRREDHGGVGSQRRTGAIRSRCCSHRMKAECRNSSRSRHGRMMQSPFAFYRGGAAMMAVDLASTAKSGLIVQACGDAHLSNFGGFATPERNIIFDINDFRRDASRTLGVGSQSVSPPALSSLPGILAYPRTRPSSAAPCVRPGSE